jgi:hypothetical protein
VFEAGFFQRPRHLGAGAAYQGIFLDCDQQFVVGSQLRTSSVVERLDEAHVGDRGVQCLARFQRRRQQAAEGEQGDPLALPADFALAQGQGAEPGLDRAPGPLPRG